MTMRSVNGPGRFHIGKTEAVHILVACAALSIAFSIMFRNGGIKNYFVYYCGDYWLPALLGTMFVIMLLSFVGHEMGHKYVAQKYGFWSEFRAYPTGLFLGLAMSFFGFIVALPGAVMIRGNYITDEQEGKISIAGPLVNMILAAIGLIGVMLTNHTFMVVPFYLLLSLNSALGLFNMIPFPPLDGYKIARWSVPMLVAGLAIAGIEFVSRFFLPALYFA